MTGACRKPEASRSALQQGMFANAECAGMLKRRGIEPRIERAAPMLPFARDQDARRDPRSPLRWTRAWAQYFIGQPRHLDMHVHTIEQGT